MDAGSKGPLVSYFKACVSYHAQKLMSLVEAGASLPEDELYENDEASEDPLNFTDAMQRLELYQSALVYDLRMFQRAHALLSAFASLGDLTTIICQDACDHLDSCAITFIVKMLSFLEVHKLVKDN